MQNRREGEEVIAGYRFSDPRKGRERWEDLEESAADVFYEAVYHEKYFQVVPEGSFGLWHIRLTGGGAIPVALQGLFTDPRKAVEDIKKFKSRPKYRKEVAEKEKQRKAKG